MLTVPIGLGELFTVLISVYIVVIFHGFCLERSSSPAKGLVVSDEECSSVPGRHRSGAGRKGGIWTSGTLGQARVILRILLRKGDVIEREEK